MAGTPDVEPHGPLVPFGAPEEARVFTLVGSVVFRPLVRIPRTMTVVRDGEALVLINAVRLRDDALPALEALGRIAHVVRIGTHAMDDAFYVERYGARSWSLPGMRDTVERTDVLAPDHLPAVGMRLFSFEHTVAPEGALLLEQEALLITCDSVQNWEDTAGCSLAGKVAAHAMGFLKPAQIGPPWRKRMTPPGGSLRPDFERLLQLPFRHLVGGHGVPLRDVARERLQETIDRELPSGG